MADKEDVWERTYETEAETSDNVRYRCYIERHIGSRDQVVVHTYQEHADEQRSDHDIWRFWLIDEEDRECKYKTTRGNAEPSDLALYGLQEYGWDCTNFDVVTEDEFEAEESDQYHKLARTFMERAGALDDPAREDLMVEMYVRAELYSALTNPDGDGSDALAAIYGENPSGAAVLDLEIEIPEFVPDHDQASVSNAVTKRFQELIEQYSDTEYVLQDERTIR